MTRLFIQTQVDAPGHRVIIKELKPIDSKIKAVRNWKALSFVHELRSFLRSVGYYRNFISNYAQIIVPI